MMFNSCSDNLDKRIELLEEELNIELPAKYEVMQDDDVSHNGFESDYTLIVKLQLEPSGTENVLDQIRETPYFNQVGKYFGERHGGIELFGQEEIDAMEVIKDSIPKTKYRATWFKRGDGYKLMDLEGGYEPINAFLDTVNNTLKFVFNHL